MPGTILRDTIDGQAAKPAPPGTAGTRNLSDYQAQTKKVFETSEPKT